MLKRILIDENEKKEENSIHELSEESKGKFVFDSNVESWEDSEKQLTAVTMAQEGIEEKTKLREMFPNSFFFPICYDNAIIGVNPLTESVIYDYWSLGYYRILFVEWTYPDYGDTLYGGERMISWIKNLNQEKTEGKVPPTLCLLEMDKEKWKDVRIQDWGTPVERVRLN